MTDSLQSATQQRFTSTSLDEWLEKIAGEFARVGRDFDPFWQISPGVPVGRVRNRRSSLYPAPPSSSRNWQAGMIIRSDAEPAPLSGCDWYFLDLPLDSTLNTVLGSSESFCIRASTLDMLPALAGATDRLNGIFLDSTSTSNAGQLLEFAESIGFDGPLFLIEEDSAIQDPVERLGALLVAFENHTADLLAAGLSAEPLLVSGRASSARLFFTCSEGILKEACLFLLMLDEQLAKPIDLFFEPLPPVRAIWIRRKIDELAEIIVNLAMLLL